MVGVERSRSVQIFGTMVLLFSIISTIITWIYYNLYDYFAFLSGMYVTVIALDEVVNRVDSDSDTEDVFEEAEEEFRVNAPLARPEEVAGLNGRGQKVLDADHTNVLRPEEASLLLASSSASAVVHSSLTQKEVDYFGKVKRDAYALNSFIPKTEIVMEKQEKVNLLGSSPALVQRPVYQEKLGEYIFR